MPFGLGPTELIIILAILLLLFGASRIPQIARSLGKASKEFKKGIEEGQKQKTTPKAKERVQKKAS